MNRTISTVGLVAALAMGCGSTVSSARIATTESAVQSARAAGAETTPGASEHLTMAEHALANAKALNGDKKGEEAEAMLTRADSDAALAAALADEARKLAPTAGAADAIRAKQPPATPSP